MFQTVRQVARYLEVPERLVRRLVRRAFVRASIPAIVSS